MLNVRRKESMTANRYSFLLMASMLYATGALCDEPRFADVATVSMRYELTAHPPDGTEEDMARGYPNLLRVFLQIRNTHDSDLLWVGNSVRDIEAQLIDEDGQPVHTPPTFSSIQYNDQAMLIPRGSSLEWMISHMGVSMVGDRANEFMTWRNMRRASRENRIGNRRRARHQKQALPDAGPGYA